MKTLKLADMKGLSVKEIKEHLVSEYEATKEWLKKVDILIAYESVGSWGCDSSSFFLFQDKMTKRIYENHGSHCSCNGFEGQFEPEMTNKKYLKSDKFGFSTGGYDDEDAQNKLAVKNFIAKL